MPLYTVSISSAMPTGSCQLFKSGSKTSMACSAVLLTLVEVNIPARSPQKLIMLVCSSLSQYRLVSQAAAFCQEGEEPWYGGSAEPVARQLTVLFWGQGNIMLTILNLPPKLRYSKRYAIHVGTIMGEQ